MRLHIIELTKQLEETNMRLKKVEQLLEDKIPNVVRVTEETKPQHHISKYANLEETKEETNERVLVEDVNSDSDS